ncbi:hypothetical protein C4559_03865 [Candidatus Microgenomates bacterium]|nr:MAG: hypothetical protein C4559_03865 [Candidatus Microgenomates bacterium]
MLTQNDLSQIRKIIKEVVRDEIGNETQTLKDELQADITMARIRIQNDVSEITDRMKNIEIRISKVHKDLKNEIKLVSHFLDKENIKTLKKVEKIEEHLGILTS